MEKNYDVSDVSINVELDDGRVMDLDVLVRFPLNDMQYIALSPSGDETFETIYLYRFAEDADGQPILTNIETDEEYEAVADRFDEILDEIEYDVVEG